jgi:hypothetical protein
MVWGVKVNLDIGWKNKITLDDPKDDAFQKYI